MKLTTTAALQINQILRQGSLVLISIVLAKSGLPTADIGIFESLLFIGTTVSFFWINALAQGTLAHYATASPIEKPQVKFNIFLVFNGLSLVILCILYFFKANILPFLTGQTTLPYFELYCVYLVLNLPPIALESLWTVEETPLSISLYSIISHALLPFTVALPLCFGYGLKSAIEGMILIAVIRYILLIINILHNKNFTVDIKIIRSFLLLCLPLMGYSFLGGFMGSFSSWIVTWFYKGDLHAFAVFRYGAREFPVSLALMTVLSNTLVPVLASNVDNPEVFHKNLTLVKNKSLRLWHWLFPMSIVLMLTSKWLFKVVFNPDFAESASIFNIYLLLIIARALFPQSILLALKETKTLLWISIIETFSLILLSFLLIFPFHTEGVAWATVVAYLIEKIAIMWFLKRKYGLDWASYTDVLWYLGYGGLLVFSYFIA